jgi:RND superfamily putative drug exporter
MFERLGKLAAARPWLICAAWIVAGILVSLIAPDWNGSTQDDDINFLPARCDSVRGYRLLQQAFPQDVFASRIIFCVERPAGRLLDSDLALVNTIVGRLERLRQEQPQLQINRICCHRDPFIGKRLLSSDGQCTLIQVSLGTPYLALQTRTTVDAADSCVRACLADVADPPTVHTTGPAGIGRDLIGASANSLQSTTVATIILVVVILLLVHRSPLMAFIPLATIAISVWVALKLLALCTLIPGFCLMNISQIFAIVMLYGAGTDYCLFLMSRYREELGRGRSREQALQRSVVAVGGALTASAGTVICGLGLMGLAEFAKVRCGGPAIGISLAVALVASLTLAPALLQILGRWAFWPCPMPRRDPDAEQGERAPAQPSLWDRISGQVVRRPLLVWGTAVAVLLPLALVGTRVQANYRATSELSARASSVQGLTAIQKHFTAGEVGPITVLLESGRSWDGPAGRALIGHLSRGFAYLPNVAEVRSLTQPLGTPLTIRPAAEPRPAAKSSLLRNMLGQAVHSLGEQISKTAGEFYLSRIPGESYAAPDRHVTRLDVVLKTDPFDPQSAETLGLVQLWLRERLEERSAELGPVRAECYGVTVNARDLAQVTESDRLRINLLVLGGIFLILLFVVRHAGTAAYLLATVLFSYYATLGATTLMGYCWGGRALGEVDWRVPFFLFTILVAVGEDYNILLITRALQERKKRGAVEGTRHALARTGGTITSCGLIMAGTFATLMLGGLSTLVQIGFALALGVLLDTFVVRPFLVPAFTVWLWQRQEEKPAAAPQPPPAPTKIIPEKQLRRAG